MAVPPGQCPRCRCGCQRCPQRGSPPADVVAPGRCVTAAVRGLRSPSRRHRTRTAVMSVASREEHIGLALEAAIRSRIKNRAWYRRNRAEYPWADYERENDRELRLLFSIRSEGRRAERFVRDMVDRRARAAHEAAEWAESVRTGQYVTLPDVPLADPGDWFVGVGR